MSTLEKIEKEVLKVKASGQEIILVDKLLEYIVALKSEEVTGEHNVKEEILLEHEHEKNLEYYKMNNHFKIEHAKMLAQDGLEMFKSVIATGKTALQSVILLNGGAAVALLTFIGGLWGKPKVEDVVHVLILGVSNFAYGALAGALAAGATYICQFCYGYDNGRQRNSILSNGENAKLGKTKVLAIIFHFLSIVIVLVAYYYFWQGLSNSFDAINIHFSASKPE